MKNMGKKNSGTVGKHRKMFREPGLARQALGILASSKDLMQQAQPQPRMQMAQAGAVNKSMFDQATRMVDGMIASGKAPAANRDAAINNLYRYYENQQQQQAPAPRMQGYMDPQSGPVDTTAARGMPAAVGGAIAGFKGAGIGSMLGPEQVDTPAPAQPVDSGRALSGFSRSLDPGLEMERREQRALAERVFKEAGGQDEVDGGLMDANASPISVDDRATSKAAADELVKANKEAAAKEAAAEETAPEEAAAEEAAAEETPASNADSDDNAVVEDQWKQWQEATGNQNKNDFWNAVMMAGLGIAAGQSDDPATNIAAGAIAGLKQYNSSRAASEKSMFTRFMQEKELELLDRKTVAAEKTADAALIRAERGVLVDPTDLDKTVRDFNSRMSLFHARLLAKSREPIATLDEIREQQALKIKKDFKKKPGDPINPTAGGRFKVNQQGKVVEVK